jgi:hypothetical protein
VEKVGGREGGKSGGEALTKDGYNKFPEGGFKW